MKVREPSYGLDFLRRHAHRLPELLLSLSAYNAESADASKASSTPQSTQSLK